MYGSDVAAEGWLANLNVALHNDIHARAAAVREQAWQGYRDATNAIDRSACLLFGVGLTSAGEVFAHGGLGIAEVVSFGGVRTAPRTGLGNPFKEKTAAQIDGMFRSKGFEPRGYDPVGGKGGYVNPSTGRSYHIDEANIFGERPHVDVNRLRNYDGMLDKKKYFMGE